MRRMVLLLVPLAVGWMPMTASAGHWSISVQGGAVVPTGDFADKSKADAQLGWQIGGSYDYHWTDIWTFGLDGGLNQNAHGAEGTVFDLGNGDTRSLDEDRFTTWQFGAHTRYTFPTTATPMRWHAQAGGSFYGLTENYTETMTLGGVTSTRSGSLTDKRAGLKFGLGGTWWTNPQVGIQAGLDYNIAFFDKDQTESTISYAGVHAGLIFKIPDTASLPTP